MAGDGTLDPSTRLITIPGVNDILRLPSLEDETIKRERITRWTLQAQRTSIPEPLRWLPQVINWLDDAQDVLITALTLGIPLLRRLPSRFLPYLGWGLLVNDALNLFAGALSAPLNPRAAKIDFLRQTKRAMAGRTALVASAEAFLLPGRQKFLPFALQAGQVLYSFTGWGLQLGAVMSALSEGFWSSLRQFAGDKVVVMGPPPADPLARAARVLVRSPLWPAFTAVANAFEHTMMVAATAGASNMLNLAALAHLDDARLEELAGFPLPLFRSESRITEAILTTAGFPPISDQRAAVATAVDHPRIGPAVRTAIATAPDIDTELAALARTEWVDWPDGMIATEVAQQTWDAFGSGLNAVVPLNSPMERVLGFALEEAVVPPFLALPNPPDIQAQLHQGTGTPYDGIFAPALNIAEKTYIHDFRFAATYPPPSTHPHVQLAHWCAIGLAILCKRKVLMGGAPGDLTQPDVCWTEWIPATLRSLPIMATASLLVWGNVYVRAFAPPQPEGPRGKLPGKLCVPNPSGWPGLSGYTPEYAPFQEVLDRLPPPGMAPQPLPACNRGLPPILDRNWLVAWLKAEDARRATGPDFPPAADQVRPVDSPPIPLDAERHRIEQGSPWYWFPWVSARNT